MLEKTVFKEEMQKLVIFYPNWGFRLDDKETMSTWYNMMKVLNVTNESLTKAVIKHIESIKFNPTIASLIDCDLTVNNKPKYKIMDLSEVEIDYGI